jgi:hypothetical protein
VREDSNAGRTSSNEIITRTFRVWLDREGIIQHVVNPGTEHDLTAAQENLAADEKVAQGRRRPLLVDMSQATSINRHARAYYSKEGPRVACAIALVVGSPLSRMMGNFFVGFQKPSVPLRLFSTSADAAAWLRQFLKQENCTGGVEA